MEISEMITECQTNVGVKADGDAGTKTWTAIYTRLLGQAPPANTSLDALIKACQTKAGVTADGDAGQNTWTAVYTKLFGHAPAPSVYTELADGNHNDPWPPPAGFPAFIHKATEGTFFSDSKGVARRDQFKATGGKWGWYHFTSGENATAQANHFLSYLAAAGYNADELVCLDFENSSRSGDRNMTPSEAETWIQVVEARLNCKVCVYGSNLLTDALQDQPPAFAGQPLWPAKYSKFPPVLPAGRSGRSGNIPTAATRTMTWIAFWAPKRSSGPRGPICRSS